ncbi:chain length determinant protein [Providencia rettgeri DSM 1131]|uniref:Wzz/FepE/Etk N-terminal domain-containing protein n=1 Tax=Providencia rettgeri TaxID=587 RepID=UPI000197C816|nr:chain length determinant protein [Providencia rettgeri DSM 1131]
MMENKKERNQDEIDLFHLANQLWVNKKTIIIFIIVFIFMGCVYLVFAKPKWTSQALISLPEIGQLSNYPTAVSLSLNSADNMGTYDMSLPTKVFNLFLANVDADIVKDKSNTPLSISKPKDANYYILSLSASNAKLAQLELTEWLNFLNKKTQSRLYQAIWQSLEQRKSQLLQQIKAFETSAKDKKQQRLTLLESALKIAQDTQLNVNEIKQLPNIIPDDALFMMGAPALNALIQQEKEWPLTFDPRYFDTQVQLSLISSFQLKEQGFDAINIISPPSLALHRESPKVTLILVLSIMLGGVVGVGYVLLRQTFITMKSEYHPKRDDKKGNPE